MEQVDKVKFARIMRDLCNFMQKVNQEDNIELRFNTSEDKFKLCRVEGDRAELLDWYTAPVNCCVEYSTIDDELSSRIKLKTSEEKQDVIHVVHQKCFEGGDLNFYHIYLYKNLNDAEKFIAEKTGYDLTEVRALLSTGDCIVRMDYFDYSIEEVEVK